MSDYITEVDDVNMSEWHQCLSTFFILMSLLNALYQLLIPLNTLTGLVRVHEYHLSKSLGDDLGRFGVVSRN
jgi:hypothetical protein